MGMKFQDSTTITNATWTSATTGGSSGATVATYAWGYCVSLITVQNTGSITGGVITFEGWDGYNWYPILGVQISSSATSSTTYALSGGTASFYCDINAFSQFRARLSTAITGTGSVFININSSAAGIGPGGSASSGGGGGGGSSTNTNTYSGQVTPNTTATALGSTTGLTNGVIITAPVSNTGIIYVGASGVSSTTGYPLSPGAAISIGASTLGQVYVIATNSSDIAAYIGN